MATRSIHPFPARMAPEIAMSYLNQDIAKPGMRVLDPMCGSGTVLSVAAAAGFSAQGYDVDPLAVLMSQVSVTPSALDELVDESIVCVDDARRSRWGVPWKDPETRAFAEYWFGKPQRVQLSRLSRRIMQIDDADLRSALQIALSRTIVTKSPRASLAADTAHSRPHRVVIESNYDVYEGFLASARDLKRILDRRSFRGTARAELGDSRRLSLIDASSIDLAITSPPYLNAIDYLRGHRLSLIWLGYTVRQLRTIRADSIGAERGIQSVPKRRVSDHVNAVQRSAARPEHLPLPTITRFAHDVCLFADELARVVAPRGMVIAVVGNSTLKGNFIANDELVSNALLESGFNRVEKVERELPPNRRYLPISRTNSTDPLNKRMRTESVITAYQT